MSTDTDDPAEWYVMQENGYDQEKNRPPRYYTVGPAMTYAAAKSILIADSGAFLVYAAHIHNYCYTDDYSRTYDSCLVNEKGGCPLLPPPMNDDGSSNQ